MPKVCHLPTREEEDDGNREAATGDREQEVQAVGNPSSTYRHDLVDHRDVFGAIVVLTQLAIQNGEPLFPVEYND